LQLLTRPQSPSVRGWLEQALRGWNVRTPTVVPPAADWPRALRWAAGFGYLLLFLQLLAQGWWSQVQISHFAATQDFANVEQAISQIAHGVLDPHSTIQGWVNGVPVGGTASFSHQLYFWQDHSEFIVWPLSLFQLVWPHPVTLKWLQDLAAFGAQAIAFRWITELAATSVPRARAEAAATLVGAGAVLLAVDPGFLAANTFDVHTEAFAAFAALGTARALYYGHRTVWIWLIAGLACGDVGAGYEAAVGLSALFLGRRWLRPGLLITAGAVGWNQLLGAIGGTKGTRVWVVYANLMNPVTQLNPRALPNVGTLLGNVIQHPGRVVSTLWANRDSAWKNIAPGGIFGWLWLPVLIPAVVVLSQAQLSRVWDIYEPGFQSIAAYALIPVGTVAILLAGLRARRAATRVLTLIVAAGLAGNTIAWAATLVPRVTQRWSVPAPAVSALRRVSAMIRPDDEVIASQGIAGVFAARASIYPYLMGSGLTVPVQEPHIWVIFAASAGIEPVKPTQTDGDILALLEDGDARLKLDQSGVWAFEVSPPRGASWFSFTPPDIGEAPAWLLPGAAGKVVRTGPLTTWHAASTGTRGFVESGASWPEGPGSYVASFRVAAAGGTTLQVRDATTHAILAHLDVATGDRIENVTVPFTVAGGATDNIELKVLAQNPHSVVDVYDLNVQPA
jgi:hypothetical protein